MGQALAREWGEGGDEEYLMDRETIVQKAKTGDLILTQGSGAGASWIRWLSASTEWSHVMVVVVDESVDPPAKYCTEVYEEKIDFDPLHDNVKHTGVQFVDLNRRLRDYHSHRVAYRPLVGTVPKENADRLIEWYKSLEISKIPKYNLNVFDFIQYGSRNDTDLNVRNGIKYYVCTAWVAEALMTLGVIYADRRSPSSKKKDLRPPEGTTHPKFDAPSPGNYELIDFGLTYYLPPTLIGNYHYRDIIYQVDTERLVDAEAQLV